MHCVLFLYSVYDVLVLYSVYGLLVLLSVYNILVLLSVYGLLVLLSVYGLLVLLIVCTQNCVICCSFSRALWWLGLITVWDRFGRGIKATQMI